MNLRKKQRVSYFEPEEPNLDEYIFCDECRDYVYEYCSIHGPLLVVPDDKVPINHNFPSFVPRAALTIPHVFLHLAPSIIPGAGLGVFSTLTLPRGVQFGPYRGLKTGDVDSMYCWQIYDRNNRPLYVIDAADPNRSNWMRYVNCARQWNEQNLVAYQYRGQLYYRTIKIIPRFTELMVFYGSEFANTLHIDLAKYNAPAGYAQKFGALPLKKVKEAENPSTIVNEENEKTQEIQKQKKCIHTGSKVVPSISSKIVNSSKNNLVNKLKPNDNVKKIKLSKKSTISVGRKLGKFKTILTTNKNLGSNNNNSTKSETKEVPHKVIDDINQNVLVFKTNKDPSFIENNNNIISPHDRVKSEDCKTHTKTIIKINQSKQTREKPHNCNVCDKCFTTKGYLKIHSRIHSGENLYVCEVCNKSFTTKGYLKIHSRIHSGEKPYVCEICDKRFTRKDNLNLHLRIHTGEKPYICEVCDKRFTQNGDLKTHLRTHTGEKPYVCKICDKRFTHKISLKTHLRKH